MPIQKCVSIKYATGTVISLSETHLNYFSAVMLLYHISSSGALWIDTTKEQTT